MVRFACVRWAALGRDELYEILTLRQLVFVIEQRCAYLDNDGLDLDAEHLTGRWDGELVAYARVLAPGRVYAGASIGRVLTHPWARGRSLGKDLVKAAIAAVEERHGRVLIEIAAQAYLARFYGELGFALAGEPYDLDGIPHVHMVRA